MKTWIKKTTRASKVHSHKIIESDNHHEVAAVYRKADEAEEAANAALIAAAPELLAALQDCYSELNQLAFLSGDKLANITLDKARAAIQKATQ